MYTLYNNMYVMVFRVTHLFDFDLIVLKLLEPLDDVIGLAIAAVCKCAFSAIKFVL
jgi:hypothetical protein